MSDIEKFKFIRQIKILQKEGLSCQDISIRLGKSVDAINLAATSLPEHKISAMEHAIENIESLPDLRLKDLMTISNLSRHILLKLIDEFKLNEHANQLDLPKAITQSNNEVGLSEFTTGQYEYLSNIIKNHNQVVHVDITSFNIHRSFDIQNPQQTSTDSQNSQDFVVYSYLVASLPNEIGFVKYIAPYSNLDDFILSSFETILNNISNPYPLPSSIFIVNSRGLSAKSTGMIRKLCTSYGVIFYPINDHSVDRLPLRAMELLIEKQVQSTVKNVSYGKRSISIERLLSNQKGFVHYMN